MSDILNCKSDRASCLQVLNLDGGEAGVRYIPINSKGSSFPTTSGHTQTRASTIPPGPTATSSGSLGPASRYRGGHCWDSACIESFWEQMGETAHLLTEKIMERVDKYVSYYNNLGRQGRLGWLTPLEYAGRLTAYLCGVQGPPQSGQDRSSTRSRT